MFGHLPMRYQLTIWIAGLVLFGFLGGWLAVSTTVPLMWRAGALVGLLVGALLVSAFTHLMAEPQEAQRRP